MSYNYNITVTCCHTSMYIYKNVKNLYKNM